MRPQKKDLNLARISISLMAAGFAVLVVAPTVEFVVFGKWTLSISFLVFIPSAAHVFLSSPSLSQEM